MNHTEEIEFLYASFFNGPFPYQDCFEILNSEQELTENLIPALDWYFSTVAGYSSRASILDRRSDEELKDAEKMLSKCFFEYFPALIPYKTMIKEERTPDLYKRMQVAEELRLRLLRLINQLRVK